MAKDEIAKLRPMLNYWIQHNTEHSLEFREWAEKAKIFGETEVGEDILAAAQGLEEINDSLSRALRRLEEKEL